MTTPFEISRLVGKRFKSWNGKIYKCEAANERDITMVNENDPWDHTDVTPRAIGSSFKEIEE